MAGESYAEMAEKMLLDVFDAPSVETCQGIFFLKINCLKPCIGKVI